MTPVLDRDAATVIVGGKDGVAAYRLRDGSLAWRTPDPAGPVASPTLAGRVLIVPNSTKGQNRALDLGATSGSVRWTSPEVANDFSSPVVVAGLALFVNKVGGLSAVDVATGRERWTRRLPGACWASPIVQGDRVYFFGADGQTTVLRVGTDGADVLAENTLPIDGRVNGVAAATSRILLRTDRVLWAIGPVAAR
jgi:outer membrane protein assembly factor BamB